MDTKIKIASFAVALLLCTAYYAGAQEQKMPPRMPGDTLPPREMPSVDEMAQQKTDLMNQEIGLDEKQYKKILKYYKAEIEDERKMMEENKPSGMPSGMPQGGPGGGSGFGGGRPPMGGPGGGPSMGGGMPGGGPGMGGGMPGGGPDMSGERPPKGGFGPSDEEMDKFYEKQDKKLKKILTEAQYDQWRAKHPVPVHMPEPEWVE